MTTDPELKKFLSHIRSTPSGWHSTTLPGIKTYKDNKGWTIIDPERDTKFGEAFDWASEFISHEDWIVVKDDFVFKKQEDAARFIFMFCT
jgi:hypothetical protein